MLGERSGTMFDVVMWLTSDSLKIYKQADVVLALSGGCIIVVKSRWGFMRHNCESRPDFVWAISRTSDRNKPQIVNLDLRRV